jgi:hypothetical protein
MVTFINIFLAITLNILSYVNVFCITFLHFFAFYKSLFFALKKGIQVNKFWKFFIYQHIFVVSLNWYWDLAIKLRIWLSRYHLLIFVSWNLQSFLCTLFSKSYISFHIDLLKLSLFIRRQHFFCVNSNIWMRIHVFILSLLYLKGSFLTVKRKSIIFIFLYIDFFVFNCFSG